MFKLKLDTGTAKTETYIKDPPDSFRTKRIRTESTTNSAFATSELDEVFENFTRNKGAGAHSTPHEVCQPGQRLYPMKTEILNFAIQIQGGFKKNLNPNPNPNFF